VGRGYSRPHLFIRNIPVLGFSTAEQGDCDAGGFDAGELGRAGPSWAELGRPAQGRGRADELGRIGERETEPAPAADWLRFAGGPEPVPLVPICAVSPKLSQNYAGPKQAGGVRILFFLGNLNISAAGAPLGRGAGFIVWVCRIFSEFPVSVTAL